MKPAARRTARIAVWRSSSSPKHGEQDARLTAIRAQGQIGDAGESRPGILDFAPQNVSQLPAQQIACAGLGYGCQGI